MNKVTEKTWYEKLNLINTKYLMPIMALMFLCTNTVINMYCGEHIETLQNIVAIMILGIVCVDLLFNKTYSLNSIINDNKLIIIYFIIRAISLWQSGFDYSVLRTIFFELFFLVGIKHVISQDKKSKKFYLYSFLIIELAMTGMSLLIYYMMPHLGTTLQQIIVEHTYYLKFSQAAMFSNVNTAGIMAGCAIVATIVLYRQHRYNNKLLMLYGVYNLFSLIVFGCRSAELAIIVVAVVFIFKKIFKSISNRKIVLAVLVIMILSLVPIYGIVLYNESNGEFTYTEFENKINTVSSARYCIWKECVITQTDKTLFGYGNLKLEQEARVDLMKQYEAVGVDYRYFITTDLGPHNGYIGMISGTGWLGFIAFMAILMQRIRRSKNLNKNDWYLLLVFIFVINCFESLFILNRFFTCFYMFLILDSDWESDDHKLPQSEVSK